MRHFPVLAALLALTAAPAFAAPPAMPVAPAPDAAAPAAAIPAAGGFTDAQKAEIEAIIRDYLVNRHPEVLSQGLQHLQQHEQDEADAKSKQAVEAAHDQVFKNPNSPVAGNPNGNVTVVEFYDYNCGYCKMSEEGLAKLVRDDKNIKVIYKNFPILGPVSVEAAKAAQASVRQGKFQAFHDALLARKEHLTSDGLYDSAKAVGLDVDKLKKDMTDPAISDMIKADMKLGEDVGVRGTPMFIVNTAVYPGALQYDQLKLAVEEARKDKK